MKKLVMILILVPIFLPKVTLAQNSKNLNGIPSYNSCGENPEPVIMPLFYSGVTAFTKKRIKEFQKTLQVKDFNFHYCVRTSGNKKSTPEEACAIALENAKQQYFESHYEIISVPSIKRFNSQGQLIYIDSKIIPHNKITDFNFEITPLIESVVFDECSENPGYFCYIFACNKEDMISRSN
jgi:hypothetical protein